MPKIEKIIKQSKPNFKLWHGESVRQYAMTNFKPQEYINNLAGVVKDEWAANLKSLALKHPEMFRSEADVFRVIKEAECIF